MDLKKQFLILIFTLILLSSVGLAQNDNEIKFELTICGECKSTDTILMVDIKEKIEYELNYDFQYGMAKLFSEMNIEDYEDSIILAIKNNEARIIIDDDAPSTHKIVGREIEDYLDSRDLNSETYLQSEAQEYYDLNHLFDEDSDSVKYEEKENIELNEEKSAKLFIATCYNCKTPDVLLTLEIKNYLENEGFSGSKKIPTRLFLDVDLKQNIDSIILAIKENEARIITEDSVSSDTTLMKDKIISFLNEEGIEFKSLSNTVASEYDSIDELFNKKEVSDTITEKINETKPVESNLTITDQKEIDSSCEKSSECESNACINEKCVSNNVFRMILNWIMSLFK